MYKYTNLPQIFDEMFVINCNVHKYYTRQTKQLHVPLAKSSAVKKTVRYVGTSLWNQFINCIDRNCSFSVYKQHVKQYL